MNAKKILEELLDLQSNGHDLENVELYLTTDSDSDSDVETISYVDKNCFMGVEETLK